MYLQYQIGIQYQGVLMEVSSGSFSTTLLSSVNDAQVSGYKLFIASYGIDVYSFDSGVLLFFLISTSKVLNLLLSPLRLLMRD